MTVEVGGVGLTSLPLDVLRTEVALVTQEHHVFIGSVRDNVVLAREDASDSLIDPRTARHLEGSMNALLAGRTVVAIAHRLHTAHDAERIAVVIDGRIVELGSHDELVARHGEYADLWRAWTS